MFTKMGIALALFGFCATASAKVTNIGPAQAPKALQTAVARSYGGLVAHSKGELAGTRAAVAFTSGKTATAYVQEFGRCRPARSQSAW